MKSKSAMMSLLLLPLMMSGMGGSYTERQSDPTPAQKAMFKGEKPLSKKQKAKLKRKTN
jgi:hypothetical protein